MKDMIITFLLKAGTEFLIAALLRIVEELTHRKDNSLSAHEGDAMKAYLTAIKLRK